MTFDLSTMPIGGGRAPSADSGATSPAPGRPRCARTADPTADGARACTYGSRARGPAPPALAQLEQTPGVTVNVFRL